MKVGFIGLGRMGQEMARALLRAGHEVTGYNRTRERAEELRSQGARVASSIAELADCEVVITMLSDDYAVERIVFEKGGLLEILHRGRIHLSMSTISPRLSEKLGSAHRKSGHIYVSAPVLGRPEAAAQAKLFVLASGPADAIERCSPVFDAIGQSTIVLGSKPSAANLIKICCNLLIACVIEGLSETFALVKKSGIVEPELFVNLLLSTILSSPVYQPYGEHILREDFRPGFTIPLALKDVELVLGAGRAEAVPMPLASLLRDHLLEGMAKGFEKLDWAALSLIVQEEAGISSKRAA